MTSRAAASAAAAGGPRRIRPRARLASILVAAVLRPRIVAITPNGTSNTSWSTNDTRSAGVRASMTTYNARPTESASRASSSGLVLPSPAASRGSMPERAGIDPGPAIWLGSCGRLGPLALVDSLGFGRTSAAQVAWRLVAVANGDRSERGELRRNAERRPVGIDPLDRNADETSPVPRIADGQHHQQ